MDFFRIDGRSGPNILRLDFLFHIYIVNIANCILIKRKRISVLLEIAYTENTISSISSDMVIVAF